MSKPQERNNDRTHNRSAEPFSSVLAQRLARRDFLKGAAALAILPLAACVSAPPSGRLPIKMGFTSVPASAGDSVQVPPGYRAEVFFRWGDPIGHPSGAPEFRQDASNSAADQALQAGMHHDGMHFFPLPASERSAQRGLLAINHEYTDDGLLHPDGFANWSAEKVTKSQNAHGVSIIEVQRSGDTWRIVRPSNYARRITMRTPMRLAGPAAGAAQMRTATDPSGTQVLGTLNNCAHGYTPWGTYLTCEENFALYFVNGNDKRYGVSEKGRGYRWNEFDERFDLGKHPNEVNRFGWIVEVDPYDPRSVPVKRTALGRFAHEGAQLSLAPDGRAVFYSGDDARFEYIYKFVTRERYDPSNPAANRNLLDHGTLYVARFDGTGAGQWLELTHGNGPLSAANGFRDQADVLIRTRAAADVLRATPMDRPEWIAVHPANRDVYCTLTNNSSRGPKAKHAADGANPRDNNVFGHIIRWREQGSDPAALHFQWDIFALCGDPQHPDPAYRGNIKGDGFGSPDGIWFDERGLLWIQTDVSAGTLNKAHYARLGNNQMLCADVASGEIRRFLTGPLGAEVTGVQITPDGRTLFVNIQHPGENPSGRNDPAKPKANGSWPDGASGGRPRSATVMIRRDDGGIIGT
jgi:hypothetical protein